MGCFRFGNYVIPEDGHRAGRWRRGVEVGRGTARDSSHGTAFVVGLLVRATGTRITSGRCGFPDCAHPGAERIVLVRLEENPPIPIAR